MDEIISVVNFIISLLILTIRFLVKNDVERRRLSFPNLFHTDKKQQGEEKTRRTTIRREQTRIMRKGNFVLSLPNAVVCVPWWGSGKEKRGGGA